MDMTDLTGSVVALVTPFKKDGSVDFERLEGLVDFHLANGPTVSWSWAPRASPPP